MIIHLPDQELQRLRTDTECNFVERKTVRDRSGWLRTAVAFANSTPINYPAVLFIGVNDDTSVEPVNADHDWEKQQKSVTEEITKAYPPVFHLQKLLDDGAGRRFLAVIIPGSAQRPHFSGKAYVRVGPRTEDASDTQVNALVAERSSKTYEIRKFVGQKVSFARFEQGELRSRPATLLDCSQHYVSLMIEWTVANMEPVAFPLSRIEISFNHANKCLQLEVRDLP